MSRFGYKYVPSFARGVVGAGVGAGVTKGVGCGVGAGVP